MYIIDDIAFGNEYRKDIKIDEIKIINELMMIVVFSTGEKRLFDAKFLLNYPIYKKLANKEIFEKACLDNGVITWENGEIDISPEFVYENSYEYENVLV